MKRIVPEPLASETVCARGARRIVEWVKADADRMRALEQAAVLELNDWCLAAGFVRNLVWDRLHGHSAATPLNDLDLIHFDAADSSAHRDRLLESRLRDRSSLPWSVKNQARMHVRNGDAPYISTADAMSYWVEVETAIGVRVDTAGEVELVAPLGLEGLFAMTITLNLRRARPQVFRERVRAKGWLRQWPQLKVVDAPLSS